MTARRRPTVTDGPSPTARTRSQASAIVIWTSPRNEFGMARRRKYKWLFGSIQDTVKVCVVGEAEGNPLPLFHFLRFRPTFSASIFSRIAVARAMQIARNRRSRDDFKVGLAGGFAQPILAKKRT